MWTNRKCGAEVSYDLQDITGKPLRKGGFLRYDIMGETKLNRFRMHVHKARRKNRFAR